jgi:hypothetical protein
MSAADQLQQGHVETGPGRSQNLTQAGVNFGIGGPMRTAAADALSRWATKMIS